MGLSQLFFKNLQKVVDICKKCSKIEKVVEAWLSLVERYIRDVEVASSNLVASTPRPDGQAVKTTPSHGVNPGSIPGQVTCCCRAAAAAFLLGASLAQLVERRIRNA